MRSRPGTTACMHACMRAAFGRTALSDTCCTAPRRTVRTAPQAASPPTSAPPAAACLPSRPRSRTASTSTPPWSGRRAARWALASSSTASAPAAAAARTPRPACASRSARRATRGEWSGRRREETRRGRGRNGMGLGGMGWKVVLPARACARARATCRRRNGARMRACGLGPYAGPWAAACLPACLSKSRRCAAVYGLVPRCGISMGSASPVLRWKGRGGGEGIEGRPREALLAVPHATCSALHACFHARTPSAPIAR